jgi:hypothetical protein
MTAFDLQPYQILSLKHGNASLYGEVIQITERGLCWLRPLVLLRQTQQNQDTTILLFDLRQGADLLWPSSLFQVVTDTEFLPILAQLEDFKSEQPITSSVDTGQTAHQQLKSFIQQIWQAHPKAFQQ